VVLVREIDVARDVEVQVAVLVDVQEASARADVVAVGNARLLGDVRKRAVAIVSVQDVGSVVVQVEVEVAVVVVIAGGHAQAVSRVAHAGLIRHIRELPAAVITIEGILRRCVCGGSAQGGAVEKVDVDVTVAVVVEERHTGADGLDDVPFAAATVGMNEGNSGLFGHVSKHDGGADAHRLPLIESYMARYRSLPGSSRRVCSRAARAPARSPFLSQAAASTE